MYVAGHSFMAVNTVVLRHRGIERFDLDRVGEVPGRKSPTVIPAIDAFHNPLLRERMGRMAIITSGYGLVAAAIPPIKLFTHDMAVHTGIGVVRQVRSALSIAEGKQAQTGQDTQHSRNTDGVKLTLVVQG